MSRRHRIRFLDAGGRYVCNARFCKFTTSPGQSREVQLRLALKHVAAENKGTSSPGTSSPVEEPSVATVAG